MADVHLSVSLRWLAVVTVLEAGSSSVPSVPRFNLGDVSPKTGGGYRLLSRGLLRIVKILQFSPLTLRVPTSFSIF